MKSPPWVIALSGLALGIIFDILFYHVLELGINIVLAQAFFLAATAVLAGYVRRPIPARAAVAGAFALAYAITFAVWTSSFGLLLSTVGFIVADLLFVAFMFGYPDRFWHPIDLFWVGLSNLYHLLGGVPILSELKFTRLSRTHVSVLAGLAIALPIVIVFAALFASADIVFADYSKNFFDWLGTWLNVFDAFLHLMLIGFFTFLFTHFFAAAFWKTSEPIVLKRGALRFRIESTVILAAVVALFALFLAVQAVYLFGGESAFRALDVSYSAYARRGFYELTAVGTIVLLLVLTLRRFHHEKTNRLLRALHSILIAETGVVLISAYLRLDLYIYAYGYTPARLFGLWFLIMVAILLALALINVLRQSEQTLLMRNSLVAIGLGMLFFTALAPDALSVRLNAPRATAEHPLSLGDLSRLSQEAAGSIVQALNAGTPVEGCFYGFSYYSDRAAIPDWRTWNYFRSQPAVQEIISRRGCGP